MSDTTLDWVGPYRGPCGLCGGDDARHREATGILERLDAGEAAKDVAADHGVTIPDWIVDVWEGWNE